MRRLRTLQALMAALRGEPTPGCDWPAVIALANQSLVTPQLAAAVLPLDEGPSPKFRGFLEEVLRRNRERNARLWSQLLDGVAALNVVGVTPVAMKGAALWLFTGESRDRLMSDIDLLVEPEEVELALAALTAAGFDILRRQEGALPHVVAELGRPQDVGYLDLHQSPPGPPGLLRAAGFAARRTEVDLDGLKIRLPDAAAQILQLVLHDQFHDGDYWRGGFDLRHSLDLARLAPTLAADDWAWLEQASGTDLVRTALNAQLLSAERLGAGAVPGPRTAGRWTHHRWMLQYAHPALRLPLGALALAAQYPAVRAHRRTAKGLERNIAPDGACARPAASARPARLAHIMTVRPGKI